MEEQQQQIVIKPEDKKKSMERMIRILTGIFFVIALIILIVFKIQKPEFNLLYLILIIVGLTIISFSIFFSFKIGDFIRSYYEKDDGVPDPINEEQILEILNDTLISNKYYNMIERILYVKPHNIGDNLIYDIKVEPLYGMKKINVIINATYPNIIPSVLYEPPSGALNSTINSMSTKPKDSPDVETTTAMNQLTGNVVETKKIKHNKDKKEDKKEEKEIL